MKLSKDIEDIILKASMKADVNVAVSAEGKVIYYIGDTEKCDMYMYSDISQELKEVTANQEETFKFYLEEQTVRILNNEQTKYFNQAIYKSAKRDMIIVFFKTDSEFNDNDKFIINSTAYLLEKFE